MRNIKEVIKAKLVTVKEINKNMSANARKSTLVELKRNIDAGQTAEENAGIVKRYLNTKPRPLNQMQQAFQDAL